jgi:hypothetical protein
MSKGKDGTIDLYAPLATSAWRPISNKASKASLMDAAATENMQSSINKYLVEFSSIQLIRDKKYNKRWAMPLKRQKEKM